MQTGLHSDAALLRIEPTATASAAICIGRCDACRTPCRFPYAAPVRSVIDRRTHVALWIEAQCQAAIHVSRFSEPLSHPDDSTFNVLQFALGFQPIVDVMAVCASTREIQVIGTARDIVTGVDWSMDQFDVPVDVTDAAFANGSINEATFDADIKALIDPFFPDYEAIVVVVLTGDLAGRYFLIVDANGSVAYEAGTDLAIELVNQTNVGAFGESRFI